MRSNTPKAPIVQVCGKSNEEVLQVWVLYDLLYRFPVGKLQAFLNDESAEGDANRYRRTARKSRREA